MFQPIKHAIQSITRPQLQDNDDDDEEIYYPARSMTKWPPGVNPLTYLNDPSIKNRKITYPPIATVQVIFQNPEPKMNAIESIMTPQLPDDDDRKITSPPKAPVQVNFPTPEPTISDLLGMNSPSPACFFKPPPSASTRTRAFYQPRVKKRLASVRCIQLSPALAKVKKRSYDAINQDESVSFAVQDSIPDSVILHFSAAQDSGVHAVVVLNSSAVQDSDIQASVDLDYELPEFLVLKEKLIDAQEPRETVNLSFLSVKPCESPARSTLLHVSHPA